MAAGDGTCEQRTYYAQNWRGDVVNTLDSTGARRETVRYSTYGVPFGIASGDVDGSGSVVAGDAIAINAQIGKTYGVSGYTVLLDVDLDGDVDINDWNISNGQSGLALGHGTLSDAVTSTNGGNRLGYAGYAWDNVPSKYAVRHRMYDPLRGRWSRRDPLGYIDSPTLYAYVNDRAMAAMDPTGLLGDYLQKRIWETSKIACAPYSALGADSDTAAVNGCGFVGGTEPQTDPYKDYPYLDPKRWDDSPCRRSHTEDGAVADQECADKCDGGLCDDDYGCVFPDSKAPSGKGCCICSDRYRRFIDNSPPVIDNLVMMCLLTHEEKHYNNHPFTMDPNTAECEAYKEHLQCLEDSFASGICDDQVIVPQDWRATCYQKFNSEIARIKKKLKDKKCGD